MNNPTICCLKSFRICPNHFVLRNYKYIYIFFFINQSSLFQCEHFCLLILTIFFSCCFWILSAFLFGAALTRHGKTLNPSMRMSSNCPCLFPICKNKPCSVLKLLWHSLQVFPSVKSSNISNSSEVKCLITWVRR